MPTPAKSSKPALKPSGKDIRMFFSGASAKPKPVNVAPKGKVKSSPIEILSDEDVKLNGNGKTSVKPADKKSNPPVDSEDEDEDDETPKPTTSSSRKAAPTATTATKKRKKLDSSSDEYEEDSEPVKRASSSRSGVNKKKKLVVSSDDEEDDEEEEPKPSPPKKRRQSASTTTTTAKTKPKPRASTNGKTKVTPASKKQKVDEDEDYEMSDASDEKDVGGGKGDDDVDEDEEDLLPTKKKQTYKPKEKKEKKDLSKPIPAPTPTAKPTDAPKKTWHQHKAANAPAPNAGSKSVPEPLSEDCLAGLTLVFTGELSAFSRDEAVDLAKRYGGRVTGAPSRKTSYVVVGENAGAKKLETIAKLGIKSLDEDGFLNLIGTRDVGGGAGAGGGKGAKDGDPNMEKKREKEREAVKKAAKEMEKRERDEERESKKSGKAVVDLTNQLWTTKYAPKNLKEICGNKSNVEKLLLWLQEWQKNSHSGFKKPGKHAMGTFRAVCITGSPGIGKTTSAHLCAKMAGYVPIEMNASDTRSKKLVEGGLNVGDRSLDGWMKGGKSEKGVGDEIVLSDRCCLIMDEVDGMSAGDRGGVGALNALIKKTKIPIICIANDRNAIKLKPLLHTTFHIKFAKPEASTVRSRVLSIVFKEKMKIPANVVDQLITGAQSDIRQVLNMLSTWRLGNDSMSFDEGKNLAKMNEKYAIMTPFDVTNKILGPYLFSQTSRETLGDKMELYFHDHSFVPLFIQENYLKTQPARARNLDGPEKILKQLELMDKAASSISDGDLVDALIHGPEQHWALMPLHAICSTVRPASFIYGPGMGFGGPNGMSFPQWLGQNSKQNKLGRQLTDVQAKMRLKVSGDKGEIRRQYIPALFPRIVKPLIDEGATAIDDIITHLDEYYLSKEDWDTIVELGVGDDKREEVVLKKIPPAVKTSFTRKWNTGDHPIAFYKAEAFFGGGAGKGTKKGGGDVPDIEDAFEMDDIPDEGSDDEGGTTTTAGKKGGGKNGKKGELDDDKLIKAKKPGAAAKPKPKAKPRASQGGRK